jgi:predicted MFS family arabinose efflux permease
VGIGLLTKRFSENRIILAALWLMFIGFIGWSLTPNLPVMLLVILPLAGGGWIANTLLTSGITKAVAAEEIGGMLGFSNSLESLTRVISPIVGGILFAKIGMGDPAVFSAVMVLCAIWLAYRRIILVKPVLEPAPIEAECA